MIINGFGGSSSSASVGNSSAFLASSDSLGVELTLLKATSGVGAMLADICLIEGCASASTSGLSTLMNLDTYTQVLGNSTAFGIVNKSSYIYQRVVLNTEANDAWINALPDTYTFPATTFTKISGTDGWYLFSGSYSNTVTMSVPSGGILYVSESDGTSGTGVGQAAARFTVNSRWPRGYNYVTVSVQYSYMYNGAALRGYLSNNIPPVGRATSSGLNGVITTDNKAWNNTSSSSSASNPLTYTTNISLVSSNPSAAFNKIVIGADAQITIGKDCNNGGAGNRDYTVKSIILKKTI